MYIRIETERLRIRPINSTDTEFIIGLVNSEGWLKYIGDRNISNTKAAEKYIQKILDNPNYFYNVFELKSSGRAIGIVTFLNRENHDFPDIGFAMLPNFEGKGYALEATKAYLEEIIKADCYPNIIAITMPDNGKSISLLEKLGLVHEYDFIEENETLSLFSLFEIV